MRKVTLGTISNPKEEAESFLEIARQIARKQVSLATKAAKQVDLVIVSGDRLRKLEAILAAGVEAFETANMTRDYKDVQERKGIPYVGKKWLIDREVGGKLYEALSQLKPRLNGPAGCRVEN